MKLRMFFIFMALMMVLTVAASKPALAEAPLIMEGKKTIFQKVIVHPGASWFKAPGSSAGEAITPFSVVYVYEVKTVKDQKWIRAASNTTGRDTAWILGDLTSDWKQSLVLTFSQKAGRQSLLFFKDQDSLISLAQNSNIAGNISDLAGQFKKYRDGKGKIPDNFPLVGMEPDDDEGAVPYDHFYLMPIFRYDNRFEAFKMLEVGSIDPGSVDDTVNPGANNTASQAPPVKNAIAFVIDTTLSMGPYIEECRNITRSIYDRIADSGQGPNTALAVVAFRSSVLASPEIEYTSKVISPLKTALDRRSFEASLAQVKEAKVSTHAFNEDSLAGLNTAIEELDWESYEGRVIILLTDAGPLEVTDKFNSLKIDPQTLADKAAQNNIKIVTLHIKSPAGSGNHSYAEDAYKSLAFKGAGSEAYLDILAGNVGEGTKNFTRATETLLKTMDDEIAGVDSTEDYDEGSIEDKAADVGSVLGYSIRLDYLGRQNQVRAPQVVLSWIPDKDLGNLDNPSPRNIRTVEVAVLLSKNQLSALSRQLYIIVSNANRVLDTESPDFFQSILSASTQISRDPSQFAINPDTRLADLGVLGEFLEGLPYESTIMGMTESDWYNMMPGEQDAFIRKIEAKIAAYDGYDQDVDNWAKFDRNNDGEWLYRVPLNMLP